MIFVFYHLYLLQYPMIKLFYKLILLTLLLLVAIILYQKNTYAYHTLLRINPLSHTQVLIEKEKYADAYTYLHYFMDFEYVQQNPEAQKLYKQIQEKRNSLAYKSEKFVEGIRTGTSDEPLGQASAIGSDFFLIGDIRDLILEGTHYYNDEKVDKVLVALSGIGIVASASTLFTLGSSAVAKSGVSLLKLAQKSKAIPLWLNAYLLKQAKHVRKSKSISRLEPLFQTLNTLYKRVGVSDTLTLLSRTSSLKELQGVSKLTKRYASQTPMLLKLSNKKMLTHAKTLKTIDKQTIKMASTFGSSGFMHLLKGGEKNFIKTTKRMKAYSKVGYKGELWKMLLWTMKHVSDTLLMLIMAVLSFLLMPFKRLGLLFSSSLR